MVRICAVREVTDDLMKAVQYLLPQLSSTAGPPSRQELEELVRSPATTLLVARDDTLDEVDSVAGQTLSADAEEPDGPIIGMLTLVTFRIPTGVRARIEDVVVDTAIRGRGTATALTRAALEIAAARGAHTVDLTSRPSREAANRLYQHLGFVQRETVVYRFALPS
ncbi:MAG TPA: GNAT family N-acetyltransferase [Acidimicrobiales bacterium]|nr:GNAT family N-acetyltransferase [Acidimicrobiales bacterium]